MTHFFSFKYSCDYIGVTQIIQDNVTILNEFNHIYNVIFDIEGKRVRRFHGLRSGHLWREDRHHSAYRSNTDFVSYSLANLSYELLSFIYRFF